MHQDDLKEKDKYILFVKIVLGKTASAARKLINSYPQTEATTFTFSSVFILLLCVNLATASDNNSMLGFTLGGSLQTSSYAEEFS